MNKNLHNIDDFFKKSIDDHLEEVPPDVWKNIDHGLDKKQAAFYKKRYFAFRAAAILIILMGGVTIAAILHFHQQADSSIQNVVTVSGEKNNHTAQEPGVAKGTTKDLIVESKVNGSKSNLTDIQEDKQTNQTPDQLTTTRVADQKANSKKYGAVSNDTYSAEQLSESTENESAKDNKGIKYKPVIKGPVDLAGRNRNSFRGKAIQKADNLFKENVAIKDVQRTIHVERDVPPLKSIVLAPFPAANLNRSPVFVIASASGSKVVRLRKYFRSWSLTPMYAQNVNLNTLRDDDHFRDARNNSREAKRTEQETRSFSVGMGVQKQIGRNISLLSGVQYFSSKTHIEPKTIFAKPDNRGDVRFQFYCSSGESYLSTKNGTAPAVGDSIKTNFSESEISYLQVPLLIAYQIDFGKFSLMPSAGIQTNLLLKGKLNSFLEHPTSEEEVSSSIDGLRSSYFSGVVQPQLNYKLTDRISFDFNPNINFSLTPINKGTAIKTYQNMFGLGAGVRIKL